MSQNDTLPNLTESAHPRKDQNLENTLFLSFFISTLLIWPTAIDQILPPTIIIVFLGIYYISNKRTQASPLSIDFYFLSIAIFFTLVILSGFSVSEPTRIITYSRDVMLWMSSFFLFFFFRGRFFVLDLRKSANSMTIAFWIIFLSCAVYIFIGSIEFPSLAYLLAPDFIKSSMMGKRVLMKDFGEQLYFFGFTDRVKSFFGSPIHLSCIVFLLLPFTLTPATRTEKNLTRPVIYYSAAAFMLFFAQARVAIILLLLYPFIVAAFKAVFKAKRHGVTWFFALSFIMFLVLIGPLFMDSLEGFLYNLFFERRSGSAGARSQIYQQSLEWVQNSPLLGYGTQIDVPGLDYPLGSHSTPLGLAFKYGIPAAAIMLLFLISCLFRTLRALSKTTDKYSETFWATLASSLLCYYLLLLINEFIVDVYHTLFLFSLLGAIIGSTRNGHPVDRASRTIA